MGRLFYSAEELLRRPLLPGMKERTLLYFHFRPARPADIVVTCDPDSGEIDVTPQTFGPLTDRPLTLCLHTNRSASPHSTRNLGRVGAEAVVALPGPGLVRQTWAGWGNSFDKWVRDLADEKYLSRDEQAQVGGWHRRWNELFTDAKSAERTALKKKLDALCRLLVAAEWDKVHAFLAATR